LDRAAEATVIHKRVSANTRQTAVSGTALRAIINEAAYASVVEQSCISPAAKTEFVEIKARHA
jgi:hypothetical protein